MTFEQRKEKLLEIYSYKSGKANADNKKIFELISDVENMLLKLQTKSYEIQAKLYNGQMKSFENKVS